jgi:hypothetical protein
MVDFDKSTMRPQREAVIRAAAETLRGTSERVLDIPQGSTGLAAANATSTLATYPRGRTAERRVSPMVPSWNRLLGWLLDVDSLRRAHAA